MFYLSPREHKNPKDKFVSTQFQPFNLSVISCIVLTINQYVRQNKRLLFLHLISFYINDRTIDLTKLEIIIFMIQPSSSYQPLININGK